MDIDGTGIQPQTSVATLTMVCLPVVYNATLFIMYYIVWLDRLTSQLQNTLREWL